MPAPEQGAEGASAIPFHEALEANRNTERASLLDGLKFRGPADAEAPAADAAPEQEAAPETPAEDAPPAEVEAAAEVEEAPPAEAEPEPRVDAQTAKRLEAIHRAERRAKEAVSRERQAFEKERAEWAPQVEAAKKFSEAKARAKYDPAAALAVLEIEPSEDLARQIYLAARGADDPKLRDEYGRLRREREVESKAERALREAEELKAQLAEERAQIDRDRAVSAYLGKVEAAVSEDFPVVRALLKEDRDEALSMLRQAADYLVGELERAPEPAEVAKAAEDWQRRELKKRGVDPEKIYGTPSKTPTPVAGEKRTAKTLTSDLGTPTKPRSAPKSREEERADILRALQSGNLT